MTTPRLVPTRPLLAGLLALSGLASPAWAGDLLQSYQAALAGNADFQAARAAAEAGRLEQPLARAQLLPSLSLGHSVQRNDLSSQTTDAGADSPAQRYTSHTTSLQLRQPLYRPQAWAGQARAVAQVARAEAQLAEARQALGLRVSQAYVDLLLARESQRQLQTQIQLIGAQLQAARQSQAAGQGTRTDIDDAQARLDLATARAVAARDGVDQARQQLQTLTQQPLQQLRPLDAARPAPRLPEPDSLAAWWRLAEAGSPVLAGLGAELEMLQAEVARALAGHRPSLDLVAQHSLSDRDNLASPGSRYRNTQLGLALNLPIYAGGGVDALARQATARLSEGEHRLEAGRRTLRDQVQQAFQAVRQGVQRIQALEQAERSAQQAIVSNERGLAAGARSRLDILNAQEQLSQAVLDLARERAAHLLAQLRLHALAGQLDETRIAEINQSLAPTAEPVVVVLRP